jgi:hypothetical protein
LHRALAELADREGRALAAAAAYERAYRAEPRDVRAARRAAQLFVDAGEAERARVLLTAVRAAQPGDVALLRELGWAATSAGRLREARRALDEAELLLRRRGRVDVDLWLQLASIDVAEGRSQAAFDRLRAAIGHAPERADLWRPFAELCAAHLDAPEPAEAAYARYLAHHADDRVAWLTQARLRIRIGDAGGALDALATGRALPVEPDGASRVIEAELERVRPVLLAQAYRYDALAREALGPASEGDWRWGLLLTRALVARGDPALPAWLARLAARGDLDDDARTELGLRRLLVEPAVAELAALTAPALPSPGAPALPADAMADLRAAGLVGDGTPVATAISAYGSLLVAIAEPDGVHAVVELVFGERQRAASLADAPRVPGAWRRVWHDGAPDRALRVLGRAMHGARFTSTADEPPPPRAAFDARAIAQARVDAGADADCLADLPRATRERFAAAARAAWQRGAGAIDRMASALAHGDDAAWLLGAVRLPSSTGTDGADSTAPFAGGAVRAPRWLPPLLAWLALDPQREQLERYHACVADARRTRALASAAAEADLGTTELEAAATLFLLGPASTQALAFADAEPMLGPPMAALRVATTEAILLRLDVIARGLLAAALPTRARGS